MTAPVDVTIHNQGTVWLLAVESDAARAWVAAHLPVEDRHGPLIDARYGPDIVTGMRAAGLVVAAGATRGHDW